MQRWFLLLFLVACEFGSGEEDKEEEEGPPPEPVSVVEITPAALGDVSDELVASAVVEAEASADIIPEVSGRVTRVQVDVGDVVRRGQLLATVENTTVDVGEDRASAEVGHLQGRYNELKALHGRGAVSAREVDDALHQLRTARASLKEARANQGETKLIAPFSGVVASRDVRVGQFTATGTRAFQVVDLSELRVVASLPERDLGRVAVGQEARLVSAYDAERSAEAKVTRMAPVVDAASGTFKVTLTLEDEQDVLRPGQYVSVYLEVARHESVLTVPQSAVLYEAGRPFVFIMVDAPPEEEKEDESDGEEKSEDEPEKSDDEKSDDKDEKSDEEEDSGPKFVAERRFIELGLKDVELAEVTTGLAKGDKVVTIGHTSLRDGARIREPKPKVAEETTAKTPETEAEAEKDEG